MRGAETLHEMRQNLINHFLDGKRLHACGCQQRQATHLVIQFFTSSARPLEDNHHHGDSQGHSQNMVERHVQEEKRTIPPERTVQPMQATQ